jgi:hypothetical protein
METQYVPSVQSVDAKGEVYARIAPTSFPRNASGQSAVVHRLTAYDRNALWNAVNAWFDGGPPATGTIDSRGARVHSFRDEGDSTWTIATPDVPDGKKVPLAWNSFAHAVALDSTTYGYRWNDALVTTTGSKDGPLATLPEYFHLVKDKNQQAQWVVVQPNDVPPETGLKQAQFPHGRAECPEAYVTPDDPASSWKKPGPVAGPFQAHLGDGSVVTYSWYRFADQPALFHADLTTAEREALQKRVELLHRHWKHDREYLPPPTTGQLADLDPALLVTPPRGLEIGYVPIVTRQAAGK